MWWPKRKRKKGEPWNTPDANGIIRKGGKQPSNPPPRPKPLSAPPRAPKPAIIPAGHIEIKILDDMKLKLGTPVTVHFGERTVGRVVGVREEDGYTLATVELFEDLPEATPRL